MNWLYYLAEANIYLGVFYLAYCLFLKKETYYQLNRAYLIVSCIAAFILPVLQIGSLKHVEPATVVRVTSAVPVQTTYETIPAAAVQATPAVTATAAPVIEHHFTLQQGLWYGYITGVVILLLVLLIKLYTLYRLMQNEQCIKQDKHKLIYLTGTDVAFSFLNYLFIGANAPGANTMIRHELVHIRQRHSADIIFIELLKIISWFNPCIYLLQNSLKTVHEYIADEHTAAYETDALTYSSFLVNNAYGAGGSSITHSFFNYNLLKKRIIMLNQQRSGNLARLKYLVAVPICAGLLCASTLAFSKTYGWVDLAPAKVKAYDQPYLLNFPKKKRLKVTQNGVTTLTDQFSIGQKDKQVVYTVNTLTNSDKSLLLKNNKIKVEVVDTTFSGDGKLPLPIVNFDGYEMLDHYLHENIHYRSDKDEKGGLVVIGFTLDKDRRITNTKIVKSGGSKLDELALNGFSSYKGIVNDDGGKNYEMGVYFFTGDYSIFNYHYDSHEFAGELIIANYDFVPKVTRKGYEYDETIHAAPIVDRIFTKFVIYEKNSEPKWYLSNTATPDEIKLLKEKYGYTFPTSAAFGIAMEKNSTDDKKWIGFSLNVASYLEAPYANDFYNKVIDNIKYPQKEKDAHTAGLVILNFNLGNNGAIGNVTVAKSAGHDFDEKAVNALQSYKTPIKDKAGQHSIAILFCVVEKQLRPTVSESLKNEGYVGELAISNVVSPFTPLVKYPASVVKPVSITKKVSDAFYRYIRNNIHYPAEARSNNSTGKVIVTFSVAGNKITDIEILRGIGHGTNEEVTRVLQNYIPNDSMEPGNYIMPVNFTLAGGNDTPNSPHESKDDKPKEYIGVANGFISLNEVVVVGYGKR